MAFTASERQARYRAKHPDKARAVAREYYARNAEKCRQRCRDHHAKNMKKIIERNRWYKRLRMFGLTREAFDALLTSQGNACAGCRLTDPGKRGWQVDHCHTTGATRGILCTNCNTGLGLAKDNVATLRRWIRYLGRAPKPPAR